MNTRSIWHFSCLLALILVGCRSGRAKFDAQHSSPNASPQAVFTQSMYKLDTPTFTPVEITNQLRPEWLKPTTNAFTLGPGDIFEIEIIGEPNSRLSVFVGPDGLIYYNLLPGTFVWGLTLSEATDLIAKSLAKYIRIEPEVAITLKGIASKKIWLLGSIQNPGVFGLASQITLLEAISSAGGPIVTGSTDETTDLKSSFVLRQGQFLPVDFYRLLHKGDLSQNIYLQPDDFVYLRSSAAKNVYVMGAVGQPSIVPYSDKTSLLQAISASGGAVDYAHLSQVAIIRGSLTQPRIAIVDYKKIVRGRATDVRLEPGDIIYIPFVPWQKISTLADNIIHQFVASIALNEGTRSVMPKAAPVGVSMPGGGQSLTIPAP